MPSAVRPLAVTMGDPAGVGIELTADAWQTRRDRDQAPFVFIGSADTLEARSRAIGRPVAVARITDLSAATAAFDTALPVLDLPLAVAARAGVADPANGPQIIAAIERAVALVASGDASAVVTNPIAKSVLYDAGFNYPGHTEFLAALAARHWPGAAADPVMMIASQPLKIVPLTIHIPLAKVAGAITTEAIAATVRIMAAALRRDFAVATPRIAVTGLNPHAGEDGAMGREEIDIIAPAIARLRTEGIAVSGPHPADTLFHAAKRSSYDAVLAMYHDQALIPVKTLAFDSGVNVTLGLPFVRTSPDHGTAFDIAGKGVASPVSLVAALDLAAAMSRRRSAAGAS